MTDELNNYIIDEIEYSFCFYWSGLNRVRVKLNDKHFQYYDNMGEAYVSTEKWVANKQRNVRDKKINDILNEN